MTLSSPGILRNYIHTYRQGNLVYVRNLKCASTFFSNVFESVGWQRILYSSIDWEHDHVFGHIREPIYRRSLGIVERVTQCELLEELVNDPRMSNLLRTASVLDEHTISYLDYFGPQGWKIDWIPLIGGVDQNILMTKKLLGSHNVVIDDQLWIQETNTSDPLQKQATFKMHQLMVHTMIVDLEHLFTENEYLRQFASNAVFQYFYNSVREASWPQCPDVVDFYKLPESIREELSRVHSNDWVEISKDLTTVNIVQPRVYSEKLYYKNRPGLDTFQALGPVLKDIELWTTVLEKFNSGGNTWAEISWLK